MSTAANDFLVDETWLTGHLDNSNVVLIDTRSPEAYWKGHLPNARHLDLSVFSHLDTSAVGLDALRRTYQWAFSALGITGQEARVVFYEERSDSRAARGAWLLDYLGHRHVAILDGGLAGLTQLTLTSEAPVYTAANFQPVAQPGHVIGYEEILTRAGTPNFHILDTRRMAEFLGTEVRAKRGGAIPAALHRDYTDSIDAATGRFKSVEALQKAFSALGLQHNDEIAIYCGSGARAAHTYYALRLAGYTAPRNYTGSWGEWGNRDDLPVTLPQQTL